MMGAGLLQRSPVRLLRGSEAFSPGGRTTSPLEMPAAETNFVSGLTCGGSLPPGTDPCIEILGFTTCHSRSIHASARVSSGVPGVLI